MNQLRQANTSDGGWATTQRHQHDPPNEASEGLRYLDTPGQPDDVWDETVALLAGELVALRTRLVAVEAAVGRPGPLGAPAPPTLPVLARRIATLERQAGIVPGLDLLAGPPAAATPRPARALPEPPTRGQVWRDRGQTVLAALLLLAVFAWLLRPTVPRAHLAPPVATATSAPAAAKIATPAASEQACDTFAGDGCAVSDGPLPAAAGATWTVALADISLCASDDPAATCPRDAPFAPATLIIQAGETVIWQVIGGQHTVTFPAVGTLAPPLYLAGPPDGDGLATWRTNALAAEPQGGTMYDGTALVGSGLLDEQTQPYRLTFMQPGRYVYVDLAYPGLVGEIIVLAAADPTADAPCATAC